MDTHTRHMQGVQALRQGQKAVRGEGVPVSGTEGAAIIWRRNRRTSAHGLTATLSRQTNTAPTTARRAKQRSGRKSLSSCADVTAGAARHGNADTMHDGTNIRSGFCPDPRTNFAPCGWMMAARLWRNALTISTRRMAQATRNSGIKPTINPRVYIATA